MEESSDHSIDEHYREGSGPSQKHITQGPTGHTPVSLPYSELPVMGIKLVPCPSYRFLRTPGSLGDQDTPALSLLDDPVGGKP